MGSANKELTELLVYEGKYCGRDADDDKGRDRTPDGVGFGEFPDSEDAEYRADNEGYGNGQKCDPTDEARVHDAAAAGLYFNNNIRILHEPDYTKLKTAISPTTDITSHRITP